MRLNFYKYYYCLFFFILCIDRLSKTLIYYKLHSVIILNKFLSLELFINRGISFSLFDYLPDFLYLLLLIFIAALIVFFSVYFLIFNNNKINLVFYIFIISGAISNFIDRIFYFGVLDFISFHYNEIYFPVFNFADVAIFIGVFGAMFFGNFNK